MSNSSTASFKPGSRRPGKPKLFRPRGVRATIPKHSASQALARTIARFDEVRMTPPTATAAGASDSEDPTDEIAVHRPQPPWRTRQSLGRRRPRPGRERGCSTGPRRRRRAWRFATGRGRWRLAGRPAVVFPVTFPAPKRHRVAKRRTISTSRAGGWSGGGQIAVPYSGFPRDGPVLNRQFVSHGRSGHPDEPRPTERRGPGRTPESQGKAPGASPGRGRRLVIVSDRGPRGPWATGRASSPARRGPRRGCPRPGDPRG